MLAAGYNCIPAGEVAHSLERRAGPPTFCVHPSVNSTTQVKSESAKLIACLWKIPEPRIDVLPGHFVRIQGKLPFTENEREYIQCVRDLMPPEVVVKKSKPLLSFVVSAFVAAIWFAVSTPGRSVGAPPSSSAPRTSQPQNGAVQTQMRNVTYHFTSDVWVQIHTLDGELQPTSGHDYPVFDDKTSFDIAIRVAAIGITPDAMANSLNSYVLAGQKAPLKGISIAIEKGKLHVKGRLVKKGEVPFETDGVLSPTPDGKIRLHSEKIKALHLPVKGLMEFFGIDTGDLIKNGKLPGIVADGDDLIMDPAVILPPPHTHGAVKSVQLEGQNIELAFGDASAPATALKNIGSRNYMAFRGNRLAFGKLLMNDSDLTLIDTTPADPFDFALDHYKEQLAAGYTKISSGFGLHVFMPDYSKLTKRSAQAGE